MRVDFTKAMFEVLASDARSMLISGDLGFNAFEEIAAKYPDRFLNAGVAEQNMIGAAAGLALSGMRPWVYSIAPFLVLRPLEQVRNDLCFHSLPVCLVGNGGGYTYGIMGSTHHALEDLGVLKGLPNMRLFFPCAGEQVSQAVRKMSVADGPCYLRLSISPYAAARKPIAEEPATMTRHYSKGSGVTVAAIGHAVDAVLTALEGDRVDADVFALTRFPFDLGSDVAFMESVRRSGRLVIVDEHYAAGGIGESLAAEIAQRARARVRLLAARYRKDQRYGSSRFHLEQAGIGPQDILKACIQETSA